MKVIYLLLFTLSTLPPLFGQGPSWTTVAGKAGGTGSADGTGGLARFHRPIGLATDKGGNVYVADTWNNTIRKITPGGVVSTVTGREDGTGGQARFNHPIGLAVDDGGNVYVTENSIIRKITPGGVVSTLAGSADSAGSTDGAGTQARFYSASGLAVDGEGTVYVADSGNCTIRKITPDGVVSTLAGSAGVSGSADGTGTQAQFGGPYSLAVDGAGNVYVADTDNCTIRKITPGGVVSTLAGRAGSIGSTDGAGGNARFYYPSGIAVDGAGTVYVADTNNHIIRKITPGGEVSTLAGRAGAIDSGEAIGDADGAGGQARFHTPFGLAVDGKGDVYVADTENSTIRRITPGGVVSTLAGSADGTGSADGPGTQARFHNPSGIAVDGAGTLYVADTGNHTIRRITPGGEVSTLAGSAGVFGETDGTGGNARFYYPSGIAVDGARNLYVADTYNNTIRRVTPGGVVSTLAGGGAEAWGSADGAGRRARFNRPEGIAVDGAGTLYVADTGNGIIRKITPAGVVSTLAGRADGAGAQARFSSPAGIAVDGGGNVYVADSSTIRRITPDGVVSTLAGSAGAWGSADGAVSQALFYQPFGIAVDGEGNVYVADSGNRTIRRITPEGVVSTVGGIAELYGSADGAGSQARFSGLRGIAVDGEGNLYAADTQNHTIRRGAPGLTVLEFWRQTHFGSPANSGAGADDLDPDGDGLVNLIEFALGLDPRASSPAFQSLSTFVGQGLLFSYRRSAAASGAGTVFTVEWSEDLAGPWSAQGVTESVLSAGDGFQNMEAGLSIGTAGRRFVRLRVTAP